VTHFNTGGVESRVDFIPCCLLIFGCVARSTKLLVFAFEGVMLFLIAFFLASQAMFASDFMPNPA
jgi:hypothetical protein